MRVLIVVAVLMATFALHAETTPIDSLLQQRDYFRLRSALASPAEASLPQHRRLYYEAYVHNFFHDLPASNRAIETIFKKYRKHFTDKELGRLLGKKADNHSKLYEYREAYATNQLLLSKYGSSLSEEDRNDVLNTNLIWKGLADVPAQRTTIARDSRIAYKRDKAGLVNVPVSFRDSTYDFVFDTGANLSVITESYAAKASVDVRPVVFKVRAITGIEVDARLGIARSLKLGDVEVQNAVFIVFPDSVLSFAGGAYTINGIIGFPVIEQLGEVRIDKAGFVSVPQVAVDKPIHNFGIDELMPVINIHVNNDTLPFTFDTGAQITDLNEPFYDRYTSLVESTGKAIEMKQGGAGGYATSKAWQLPLTRFTVGGETVNVPNLNVKTHSANSKDRFYYGNLGQDVMYQFRELVINFKYMYVDFVQ
ncbi:retropepsin-like aspartic protease family protein [Paraflavitalea pollutisoli]|uniref:retropepsin-like aspartic protease family protein n=1 Tax=Paraflavitalea pollutisoli TaxID=3034143 RepID=UPI0023EA8F9E|nr:retropepsin-like aspartic protease [Paraflavitalea sp. H1-2-19X]